MPAAKKRVVVNARELFILDQKTDGVIVSRYSFEQTAFHKGRKVLEMVEEFEATGGRQI